MSVSWFVKAIDINPSVDYINWYYGMPELILQSLNIMLQDTPY